MAKALEDRVIPQLPDRPAQDGILFEPTQRRVRVLLGGITVADSRAVMLMLENKRLAIYYFPAKDVRLDLFVPTSYTSHHPGKGHATFYSVKVGDRVAEKAAWRYLQPERADLKDYVAFYWDKMDAWFEEDDEVFVHPRDPYHRVDVVNSSRHVKVVVGGEVVAETSRPRLLFETGLPTRYYIPKLDVQLEADSFRVLTSLVEEGLGYSLLPPSSVRSEIDARRLESATISGQAPMRELVIASPVDHPDSTATSVITDLLRSETSACRSEGLWDIKLG